MSDCVEAYLGWLASQRRAARLTLENYRRDLEALQRLAGDRTLETLAQHDIRRFVARLHGEGLGGRSIARRLSAWRGLFRWLVRQRGLAANPAEGVRAPRAPKTLPKALSPDQAQALLDAEPDAGELMVRDRAMFELFYSSGLRLAELAALDAAIAADLDEGLLTVTGKRNKTRSVPVGSKAVAALREWLALRPAVAAADEPALFVSRRGGRLSPGAIRSRLARWAQDCGLGVHVHPHMLRHSFASHMLQSSGDLRAVQELLGHASIQSTQVYTHLDFQHLAKVYDAAHPRARKR
ncbi:tyrosine recombinase XerC [Pseudothauera rhizosphaerae]|uniref:Tyrosine recombinase XerC n=1 Tax=Pseudothauera rhizosphaerae TaxID=2565932 RepID=A0A4S4AY62_9RHOO|nr:tyrosine recombinase XerC [Pseudothauera rhizosphaerae]THF65048.1 tyrosine recombinase XerC [Pseudothauera rhizosphaerae]